MAVVWAVLATAAAEAAIGKAYIENQRMTKKNLLVVENATWDETNETQQREKLEILMNILRCVPTLKGQYGFPRPEVDASPQVDASP